MKRPVLPSVLPKIKNNIAVLRVRLLTLQISLLEKLDASGIRRLQRWLPILWEIVVKKRAHAWQFSITSLGTIPVDWSTPISRQATEAGVQLGWNEDAYATLHPDTGIDPVTMNEVTVFNPGTPRQIAKTFSRCLGLRPARLMELLACMRKLPETCSEPLYGIETIEVPFGTGVRTVHYLFRATRTKNSLLLELVPPDEKNTRRGNGPILASGGRVLAILDPTTISRTIAPPRTPSSRPPM